MRAICLARLDKTRPVLVLTRALAQTRLTRVTVATITSTVRGISSEVPVGPANGLDHESVVSLDNIQTIHRDDLGRQIGYLLPHQEHQLALAIRLAFDLP